ncbi:MAG: pimeloyl-ACP methyl ester carboxylesterase [Porticoccaceae bacterium]|jgi:pimeloyl-ACP methyl ester carboxylesterase
MSKKTKEDSDLQGITNLIVDVTIGVTNLVEAMHKQVVHPSFLPSTTIQKLITSIASITYKNIRWSTLFIGSSIYKMLKKLTPAIGKIKDSDKKEIILSVLNGVIGDYLEEKENPLKITMQFRYQSKTLAIDPKSIKAAYPKVNGKILLMIHGSCMNDLQWTRKDHNHGKIIATELNKTPIYLKYNSGLHISSNGKNLNNLLEELVKNWPVPIEELVIIAHSMGGLVSRSALYYGEKNQKKWTKHVKKIVFLGTPHHGSYVERTGNYLDLILESIHYAKPFARLGKIRSAGVTDLRYGNLIDEDWKDDNRFEIKNDKRRNIQLSKQIEFYTIAAVIGNETTSLSTQILGDTLVDVKSALGQHKNPDKNLNFKKENIWISYDSNHLDLISNPKILNKIKVWLV